MNEGPDLFTGLTVEDSNKNKKTRVATIRNSQYYTVRSEKIVYIITLDLFSIRSGRARGTKT